MYLIIHVLPPPTGAGLPSRNRPETALKKVTMAYQPTQTFGELWRNFEARLKKNYPKDLNGLHMRAMQDRFGADVMQNDTVEDFFSPESPQEDRQLFVCMTKVDPESSIPLGSSSQSAKESNKRKRESASDQSTALARKRPRALQTADTSFDNDIIQDDEADEAPARPPRVLVPSSQLQDRASRARPNPLTSQTSVLPTPPRSSQARPLSSAGGKTKRGFTKDTQSRAGQPKNANWTPEEDAVILKGMELGWDATRIAKELPGLAPRSSGAVRGRKAYLRSKSGSGVAPVPATQGPAMTSKQHSQRPRKTVKEHTEEPNELLSPSSEMIPPQTEEQTEALSAGGSQDSFAPTDELAAAENENERKTSPIVLVVRGPDEHDYDVTPPVTAEPSESIKSPFRPPMSAQRPRSDSRRPSPLAECSQDPFAAASIPTPSSEIPARDRFEQIVTEPEIETDYFRFVRHKPHPGDYSKKFETGWFKGLERGYVWQCSLFRVEGDKQKIRRGYDDLVNDKKMLTAVGKKDVNTIEWVKRNRRRLRRRWATEDGREPPQLQNRLEGLKSAPIVEDDTSIDEEFGPGDDFGSEEVEGDENALSSLPPDDDDEEEEDEDEDEDGEGEDGERDEEDEMKFPPITDRVFTEVTDEANNEVISKAGTVKVELEEDEDVEMKAPQTVHAESDSGAGEPTESVSTRRAPGPPEKNKAEATVQNRQSAPVNSRGRGRVGRAAAREVEAGSNDRVGAPQEQSRLEGPWADILHVAHVPKPPTRRVPALTTSPRPVRQRVFSSEDEESDASD